MLGEKKTQFKGMRFCQECDNMLEPVEVRDDYGTGENYMLVYRCKICNKEERTDENNEADNCVYKTDFSARSENLIVDTECVRDPTLARHRDIVCEKCTHNEAVSFTQVTKENLNLIFVCCNCRHWWKKIEPPEPEEDKDKE